MSINWLPLSHRKNISQVKISYERNIGQNYGGYYTPKYNKIVVVEQLCDKEVSSIIAHEFRHHTQWELKIVPFIIVPINSENLSYSKAIRKYFRSSISELDALIYQHKYAKTDCCDWWLKELVDDKGICKRYF